MWDIINFGLKYNIFSKGLDIITSPTKTMLLSMAYSVAGVWGIVIGGTYFYFTN
jgi:hypothetical protein